MIPTVSSMVPFSLLGQDDQKEMQHDTYANGIKMTSLHSLGQDK